MWLARQAARAERTDDGAARLCAVTIGGEEPAAVWGGERRGLTVVAPGGVAWLPRSGDEALLIRCGDEDAVAGVAVAAPPGMQPGEVCVFSAGGASVLLCNDGKVKITGSVEISGTLRLNGAAVAVSGS